MQIYTTDNRTLFSTKRSILALNATSTILLPFFYFDLADFFNLTDHRGVLTLNQYLAIEANSYHISIPDAYPEQSRWAITFHS